MMRALLTWLFGRRRKSDPLPHFGRLLIGGSITSTKGKLR